MSEVRVFLPRDGELASEADAILTTNHLGSIVQGDTGKDAQYLADQNNLRVIALDRPGTGSSGQLYSWDFTRQHDGYVDKWIDAVKPHVEPEGIKHLHAFGRSAGATHLLEVVAKDRLPVVSLGAVESIGWRNTSLRSGRLRYASYMLRTELRRGSIESKDPNPLAPVETTTTPHTAEQPAEGRIKSLMQMLGRQGVDIQNNQDLWRTDVSLKAASYIARQLPQVTVELSFAQRPMAAPLGYLKDVTAWITANRAELRDDNPVARPFYRSFIPHTTHGSFDNSRRYDERLKSILKKVNRYSR